MGAHALTVRRLRWRCRRGMKEIDLLLDRFLTDQYEGCDQSGRDAFERLLELQDPVLHAYFTGRAEPEDRELHHVVQRITGTAP